MTVDRGTGIPLRSPSSTEIANVFAKLRYGTASNFSTLFKPDECALLLHALDDAFVEDLARRAGHAESYRVALQDAQSIALNGTEIGDTEADRLFAIDQRIAEEIA